MKTNFQMMRELDKIYTPEEMGIVSMKEIYLINKILCLDEMKDEIQLRNLRDFVVLFYSNKGIEDLDTIVKRSDKVSAITCVIDNKLFNNGFEV